MGRKGSNPVGFSASLLGFPGGATGLPMVGKGGLFWAGAGVGVWGEDGGQCRAWIRKAETVMRDSFKTRAFSGGSQKVLGSLGLPWRQGSACHREEGEGGVQVAPPREEISPMPPLLQPGRASSRTGQPAPSRQHRIGCSGVSGDGWRACPKPCTRGPRRRPRPAPSAGTSLACEALWKGTGFTRLLPL